MESSNVLRAKTLALAIAIGLGGSATAARADELQDLKAQIEALNKKVGELERKQETAEKKLETAEKKLTVAAPDNVVTGGATKGSFKLPGSDTSVTLGGYVKLDAVFSNPHIGAGTSADLELNPAAIPVGPGADDHKKNQVDFGARESRLFVKTSTPTELGDLNTHVEADFYGADGNEIVSNSHGLRLRHAYGTLGNFLAGQTWTNFMNAAALPDTLDFGGPVGQIFDRQAQVRWTQSFAASSLGTGGQWSVGLENPETNVQIPGAATLAAGRDRWPDITGQVLFNTSIGKISVHGVVRQLRVDSATPAAVDQKWGGAVSVAGVLPTVGKDDFRFTASAGNAIGRYLDGFFPDAVLGADGQIRLPKQWGWFAAYRHYWFDQLRSNLVLSTASENNPAGAPANTNKSTASAHVNLIWSPVANTDLGIEYIFADRKTEDGLKGNLNRVQASAKYAF